MPLCQKKRAITTDAALIFFFFFHISTPANMEKWHKRIFGGFVVRWARGRMNWSDQLICFVEIGDNPQKKIPVIFFSSYRTEFFSPHLWLHLIILAGRLWHHAMFYYRTEICGVSAAPFSSFSWFCFFFRDRKKRDKELFFSSSSLGCWTLCFFVGSATRRCVLSSHLKKEKKIGKKGATSFDWAFHSFLGVH